MPQVTWWRDSHLIDSSFEKTFGHTVQNTLSVPQVSREDLGATLTCQASNNNISAPASARVAIDLKCEKNFPILPKLKFLKIEKERRRCTIRGTFYIEEWPIFPVRFFFHNELNEP